mmetsp:Transcript_11883/g.51171  ORF Transcript_11883/g.51171 Transcript_11883/m.51171 type:complete len:211 (+) Transcript_11883:156-788(+)
MGPGKDPRADCEDHARAARPPVRGHGDARRPRGIRKDPRDRTFDRIRRLRARVHARGRTRCPTHARGPRHPCSAHRGNRRPRRRRGSGDHRSAHGHRGRPAHRRRRRGGASTAAVAAGRGAGGGRGDGRRGNGRRSAERVRRAGGRSRHRGAHQRRIRRRDGRFKSAHGDTQLVRDGGDGGEHRQWVRCDDVGDQDASSGGATWQKIKLN